MKTLATSQARASKRPQTLGGAFLLKLELRSQPQLLCVLRGAVEPLLESLGFLPEDNRAVVRAVDEAVSNIMRHSYCGCPDKPIEVSFHRIERQVDSKTEQGVEVLLFDCGPAVDTTKLPARPLEEVKPGGLGLHIIRGSMDVVEYKRADGLNRLRLVKFMRPANGDKNP
jgi:anti-sigma regulatory factor (Ser/Thr protein kinase)